MNKRITLVAAFMLIIFFSSLPSSFAIYQWVDEKGTIHITDYPKPGTQPAEHENEAPSSPGGPAKVTAPSREIQQGTRLEMTLTPSSPAVQTPQSMETAKPAEPSAPMPAQQPRQDAVSPVAKTNQAVPMLGIPPTSGEAPSATPMPSMPNTAPSPRAVAAFAAGFLSIFLFMLAGLYLYFSLCLFLIAKKLNVPAAWTAWVPILQIWAFFGSAGKSLWWFLLFFIPLVNAIVGIYLWMCIAENLGKNKMLGLLMLIPIANLVFVGVLAFSEQERRAVPAPVS